MALTNEQAAKAREIIVAAEQPLTAQEKKLCKDLGMTEEVYLEERKLKLDEQLPGAHVLTAAQLEAARATGVSPEKYAEALKAAQ